MINFYPSRLEDWLQRLRPLVKGRKNVRRVIGKLWVEKKTGWVMQRFSFASEAKAMAIINVSPSWGHQQGGLIHDSWKRLSHSLEMFGNEREFQVRGDVIEDEILISCSSKAVMTRVLLLYFIIDWLRSPFTVLNVWIQPAAHHRIVHTNDRHGLFWEIRELLFLKQNKNLEWALSF